MPRRAGNTRKVAEVSASLRAAGKAVAKAAAYVAEMKAYVAERDRETKAAQATHGNKNRSNRNRSNRNRTRRNRN